MAIKPIDHDSTTDVVWTDDPAIDQDARIPIAEIPERLRRHVLELVDKVKEKEPDYVAPQDIRRVELYEKILAFREPGCWREVLSMRPGESPTVFKLGVIPPAELSQIEDKVSSGVGAQAIHFECFAASLRGITNGPTKKRERDGRTVHEVPMVTRGGWDRVDADWLAKTFVRHLRKCAVEIGAIARLWNHLSEDDAKN
jgi:hypothetical protein